MLAGFGYTLLIEISQLICYGRHTDIDDLILNTMGVAIGEKDGINRKPAPDMVLEALKDFTDQCCSIR